VSFPCAKAGVIIDPTIDPVAITIAMPIMRSKLDLFIHVP